MPDTYENRIAEVVRGGTGADAILQLVSAFETADIPVMSMRVSIKVPSEQKITHIGTLFGNIDVEVLR